MLYRLEPDVSESSSQGRNAKPKGTNRLVDACARADNINLSKLLLCHLEHLLQLRPVRHVRLLKDRPRRRAGVRRVLVDDGLRLGTQSKIRN